MMSVIRAPRWATNTRNLPFVIPAKAGTHLLRDGHTQGWRKTLQSGQTKGREMDSRLRGIDEVRVGEGALGVLDSVSLTMTSGAHH